jgi:hypothetical protein
MKQLFSILALAVTMLLSSSDIRASTVLKMTLEEMTDKADMIFIGNVQSQRAEWSGGRSRIYTYITFEVDRYLKGGNGSATTTIRVLGGQIGSFAATVPGSPRFADGEKVLVFCAGAGPRMPTVLGLSLGKFTLTTDDSGEAIIKRDISTLMLTSYRTDSRQPGDPVTRYRLADVEARIQSYLK